MMEIMKAVDGRNAVVFVRKAGKKMWKRTRYEGSMEVHISHCGQSTAEAELKLLAEGGWTITKEV